MRNIILSVAILLLMVVGLQNCKHDVPTVNPEPNPEPVEDPTLSNKCSPDTVYFVKDILPLLQSSCAQSGCHDATTRADGVQLTDYQSIISTGDIKPSKPLDSDFYEVIVTSDTKKLMPPPPASLTPEQKNSIRIWLQQGAKNNDCQELCDTTNVTFSGSVWPILERTCKSCHNGPGASGGVSIANYSNVKTLVDDSRLQGVLSRKPPYKPMPPAGALDSCSQAKIDIWIRNGAKND